MAPSYRTILVGIDFSALGDVALEAAVELARRSGTTRIHLAHVMQASPSWALPLHEGLALAWQSAFSVVEKELGEVVVPATTATVTRKALLGGAAYELVREAKEIGADLIVVATHKRGTLKRLVLGSVAGALIRSAPCPVLVVGEDRPVRPKTERVLAAVDLSPVSEAVLANAIELARPDRALVHAVSLYEVPALTRDGDVFARFLTPKEIEELPELHKKKVLELVSHVRSPEVEIVVDVMSKAPSWQVILDVAAMTSPELIVAGTSGHNALERAYLGSTASKLIAEAHCPVLVVPSRPTHN